MRKKLIILMSIGLILMLQKNVTAKDTVFSLNKFQEENFTFIKNGYNDNNKKDGLIVGGYYLKEELESGDINKQDYQIILGKYNKQGKLLWKYTYGKTKEDKMDDLFYTYNELGQIDGYGMTLETTYDIGEQLPENTSTTTFIKVDLTGKLVWEKSAGINKKERIMKMIPIQKEDNTLDYYIAIGTVGTTATIMKYDRDLNLIWEKESTDATVTYQDITPIWNENKVISFAMIKEKKDNDTSHVSLMNYDLEGNEISTITEQLEQYDSYHLNTSMNGLILYGITSEVKLKKGEKSYYIIKYNQDLKEEWESIGDIPIDSNHNIHIRTVEEEQEIKKYYLQYINKADSSLEVIELDKDGLFQKKIKKIQADYYEIESFLMDEEVLYFVGQINCPEDDTCDYDSNSLFLISDEDKVIEVKEEDSKNILVITIIVIISIIGIFLLNKKRKSLSQQ